MWCPAASSSPGPRHYTRRRARVVPRAERGCAACEKRDASLPRLLSLLLVVVARRYMALFNVPVTAEAYNVLGYPAFVQRMVSARTRAAALGFSGAGPPRRPWAAWGRPRLRSMKKRTPRRLNQPCPAPQPPSPSVKSELHLARLTRWSFPSALRAVQQGRGVRAGRVGRAVAGGPARQDLPARPRRRAGPRGHDAAYALQRLAGARAAQRALRGHRPPFLHQRLCASGTQRVRTLSHHEGKGI